MNIIKGDFPESIVDNSIIVVRRNDKNLATVNLKSKTVDCQDEYMRMRLLGILDEYMG